MLGLSAQAIARDPTDGKSEGLAVEKILCRQTYVHTPDANVAYQPGVDVNGNAVAPADLNAAPNMVPDYISVPLTIDLAQRLNYPLPAGTEMKGALGNLSLYKDGRVMFNGQDLSPQAQALCAGKEPPRAQAAPAQAPAEQDSVMNAEPAAAPAASQGQTAVQYVFQPGKPAIGSAAPSSTSIYVPPKGPPPMASRAEPKSPPKPVPPPTTQAQPLPQQ